jgi:BioD-like phosphotransacetylase family protein
MGKYVLFGSIEAYSGKSGIILGMTSQLQSRGLSVAYGKPLGLPDPDRPLESADADIQFLAHALGLSSQQVGLPILVMDTKAIQRRLTGEDRQDYNTTLTSFLRGIEGDLTILEGAGTLWEGSLFGLSAIDIAKSLNVPVVLVTRYHSPLIVDALLKARQGLGDRLLGTILNDVPHEHLEEAQQRVSPFLEQQGIPVLGTIPRSTLLRSVSVRELAHQLKASVLCRADRLDLMVESLTIGAMNVNSALEYFRRDQHKAVITGGDRTDLQLAALETSTSCLILTGHMSPQPLIVSRAEDLEVPILSVDLDTLTTVEIVDRAFGQVRLQEQIKVECIQKLMAEHFDTDRLLQKLGF